MVNRPVLFLILGTVFSALALKFGVIDIGGWDESLYFERAKTLTSLSADWGPIYSLYIHMFTRVYSDPIQTFDAYRLALAFFLLPVGVFLLLERLTRDKRLAIFSAFVVSTPTLIVDIDPGIQLFNLVVWLYLCSALFYFERYPMLLYIAAGAVGLLPYIRQDNTVFILTYAVGVIWITYDRLCRRRALATARLLLAAAFFSVTVFGICWLLFRGSPFSGNRPLYAFADHYFWTNAHLLQVNPLIDRKQVVLQHFGNPSSLTELLLNHFSALLPHFNARASDLLRMSMNMFGRFAIPFGIVLMLTIAVNLRRWRNLRMEKRIYLALMIFVTVKAAALCTLLSPREPYLIEPFFLMLLWCLWNLNEMFAKRRVWLQILATVLVCAFFLERSVLLQRSLGFSLEAPLPEWEVSDRDYLKLLKTIITSQGDARVSEPLIAIGQLSFFLGTNPKNGTVFTAGLAKDYTPAYTFPTFLELQGYRIVIIERSFRSIANDAGVGPGVVDFEKSYAKHGFRRVQVPTRETSIYIRNLGLKN